MKKKSFVQLHAYSCIAQNSIAFGKSTSQISFAKQHISKIGENYINTGLKMLYISWMVILGDHNI